MFVYADNAATTEMSQKSKQTMIDCINKTYGNPSSLYTIGQKAKEMLENSRESIAECIGASPKEIYFTSGGSEADNQAIISAAKLGESKGKKHIISTKFEHHAVLHTLDFLKSQGFEITLIDVNKNGIVDVHDIESAIKDTTCLITVMYANNEIGTIQPISEIGALCKKHNIVFHTDAVQAAGHININVKSQNIDMLSMSAHKFNGPKGIGILYSKIGIPLTNIIYGGTQERGKRAGTENVPGIAAAAIALRESIESLEKDSKYVSNLRDMLINELSKIPHSILNGDRLQRLPGTVNFCFEGIEGESLLLLLDDKGISASSGSACTSGSLDPSHVLLALGLPHEIAHGSLRLSINQYNSEDEVKYIIKTVPEIVKYLRSMSPVWQELENGTKQHII